MAYLEKEKVAEIRKEIKKEFKGYKISVTRKDVVGVNITILEGEASFNDVLSGDNYSSVNQYYIDECYPQSKDILNKILKIANMFYDKKGEHETADYGTMPDYYVDISVGKWDKPYKCTAEKVEVEAEKEVTIDSQKNTPSEVNENNDVLYTDNKQDNINTNTKKVNAITVVQELKENKQDFEWYPTSKETIEVLYNDIDRTLDTHNKNFSMLDVGAGNGKVLEEIANLSKETKWYNASLHKAYAIEKSSILIQQMNKDIFVLGTEFDEQTFIDKKVDVVYSNPPYSEFEKWSEKLIKEANCKVLYLLIPQRWENSHKIKQALEYREKEATVIQEYDFTNSEDRKARAKVNLVKIVMEEFRTKKSDPFAKWFNDTFQFKAEKPKDTWEGKREQREKIKELVAGGNLIKTLVELYNKDMSSLMQSYAKIAEIDTSILNELNIDIVTLTENARLKIENKKNLYWQELFDNLDKITSRLTHDIRRKMLEELTANTNIDFTEKNVYAVLMWVLKNANNYFDDQLIKVYKKLTSSDNVKFYKSNEKIVNDGWRFLHQLEEKKVKYTLDYRIIHHLGSPFNYRGNELNETSLYFFEDILTIANNLGFTVKDKVKDVTKATKEDGTVFYKDWETNKKYYLYLTNGEIFMELKIFKNGNAHLKLNQKFMKAFNIEASRLLGWVKKPKEFEEETGLKADEYFKTNHKITDVKLLLS